MGEILTSEEAATRLKLHKKTVQRLFRDGKLPGTRVGGSWRIGAMALERFINGGVGGGGAEKSAEQAKAA